jgi:hypothetical protein
MSAANIPVSNPAWVIGVRTQLFKKTISFHRPEAEKRGEELPWADTVNTYPVRSVKFGILVSSVIYGQAR